MYLCTMVEYLGGHSLLPHRHHRKRLPQLGVSCPQAGQSVVLMRTASFYGQNVAFDFAWFGQSFQGLFVTWAFIPKRPRGRAIGRRAIFPFSVQLILLPSTTHTTPPPPQNAWKRRSFPASSFKISALCVQLSTLSRPNTALQVSYCTRMEFSSFRHRPGRAVRYPEQKTTAIISFQ